MDGSGRRGLVGGPAAVRPLGAVGPEDAPVNEEVGDRGTPGNGPPMGVVNRCTVGAGPPGGDSPSGRNGTAQGADPNGVAVEAWFDNTAGTAPDACRLGAARGSAVDVLAGVLHDDGGKGTITGLEKSSVKGKGLVKDNMT